MAEQLISTEQMAYIVGDMADIERALVELREAMQTPQATGVHGWLGIDQKVTQLLGATDSMRRTVSGCGAMLAPSCFFHDMEDCE